MRYQREVEDLFRISQEYDSKTKTIHDVLLNLNLEGKWKNNDLESLGHKLTKMAALCKLRNETIKFVLNISQVGKAESKVCKEHSVVLDNTFLENFQEKLLNQLKESQIQVDIYSVKLKQLQEEVKEILKTHGHCDPADLLPYLEVGNQDQIAMLQIILQWVYPNGKSLCNKKPIGSASSHKTTDDQSTPIKSPNISCDSTVLDTEISKSDSTTMDLDIQDTKQTYKTKPFKMPKGNMPPRSVLKRRLKCAKVKKLQTPRMYKKNLLSQIDVRNHWSKKSRHDNNARLHNNTLNTKFIEVGCIMKSVIGAFHNTFPLQDRLLLKRPRVKIK